MNDFLLLQKIRVQLNHKMGQLSLFMTMECASNLNNSSFKCFHKPSSLAERPVHITGLFDRG